MRFEKVSIIQYAKDSKNPSATVDLEQLHLPTRATLSAAGYDFYAPCEIFVPAHKQVLVATGVKCALDSDKVLMLHVRSSLGIKHGISLSNTTGIIDADYYNSETNEGHILVALYNNTNSSVTIQKGDRFVQGVILQYFTIEEETKPGTRKGGIGSTN